VSVCYAVSVIYHVIVVCCCVLLAKVTCSLRESAGWVNLKVCILQDGVVLCSRSSRY
jgi:hypothetical protein